jgi:hypothetical protein
MEAARRKARGSLLPFVLYVKNNYQVNWHHALLCNYLDKFVNGEIKRLMVFMPPQHGKSELVSRCLPSYILGRNPDAKIVLASYSADLASSFNRDCQRIITSPEYTELFPGTTLQGENVVTRSNMALRNSEIFQVVNHEGQLKTVGVGGSLTGNPADFAFIDDPVKDSLEAMSPTYQVRNWNWYNDVLFTRIHNNTGILLTQTRWDERDLAGLLLESMNQNRGEKWVILTLPAVKEDDSNPDDPRAIGEALWPDRHNLEKLLMIQRSNLRTFMSLYQQKPQPTETGGEFYQQFKIWRNVKDFQYDPSLVLHLSFDFNVRPAMHATVWQIKDRTAYQIDELITGPPNNKTAGVCREFVRKYSTHQGGVIIYGDPSGNNEDTRQEQGSNDYTIIMRELEPYHPRMRVANSHPSPRMRGMFINTIFETGYNGIQIFISSKCVKSIQDLQFIKEDSDGTKLKEKAKDIASGVSYERWGHLSDSMDYFMCEAFKNEYVTYQGSFTLKPGGTQVFSRAPKYTL